ncbi:MAG: Rrf2 family transcriptional regulator [Myxococcales bacterium]|nr:Rrf2 family transcriptional regulator [Myxococcales bacterium]
MKLTKETDYGLLLLTHLAELAPMETVSVRQVAEHYGLSERFLANIVHKLANVKIVHSRRGANGGIRLGRPSSEVTVREVVEALEGPIELFTCESDIHPCEHTELCTMREFWGSVQHDLLGRLERTTVSDFARRQAEPGRPDVALADVRFAAGSAGAFTAQAASK